MPTTKLNLPLIDGTNTADVVRDMNALANAVDNKAGASDGLATLDASGKVPASQLNVSAPPDATTTTKGVVQLSNSTTSTSELLAATSKAVKDAKDGLSAQIGILSGLNTTNKSNLVASINELFTFANDGKTKWSSVIGSPLASSDTFTSMQTKTQTIKDTLATNLTAKGQSSVGTTSLSTLVGRVANIEVGRKRASGTVATSGILPFITRGGSTKNSNVVLVTGLTFLPTNIILRNINAGKTSATLYTLNTGDTYEKVAMLSYYIDGMTSESFPTNVYRADTGNAYVNSTGFQLPVYVSGTYSYEAYE